MVTLGFTCHCYISFLAWQKSHQPKPTVAADGVKMPAEKVEPLIDTTRTGGVFPIVLP
jgi:hypothetical protein